MSNEKRDSFLFYRSFFDAIKTLNKRDQTAVTLGICDYALNGIEPKVSGAAASVWILIKPVLDANIKRYKNGRHGGRPVTEQKPNCNQSGTYGFDYEKPNISEGQGQGTREHGQGNMDNGQGSGEPPVPSLSEVEAFCLSLGSTPAAAAAFFAQYDRAGWMSDGKPIENWRGLLTNFVRGGGGRCGKGGYAAASSAPTGGHSVTANAKRNAEWMRRILAEDEAAQADDLTEGSQDGQ